MTGLFRFWPLPVSLLLHGLCVAAWLDRTPPVSPRPLPRIELLPPAPVPPAPQEAMPSPSDAPVQPLPAPPTPVAPPPAPPVVIQPVSTTAAPAEQRPVKPAPPPERRRPPPPTAKPSTAAPDDPVRRATTQAAALPISGRGADSAAAAAPAMPRAAPAGPPPDYIGQLRLTLEKAKRYPKEARAAGQEGTVLLRFAIDRTGALLHWRIETGCGVPALDQEVAAMVQRAAPFPPFPASLERTRMELIVPVEFSLAEP